MKFLHVTTTFGDRVALNPEHISSFIEGKNYEAIVTMVGDDPDTFFRLSCSYDEFTKLL
jgi:hypothetical protein